MKTLKMKALAVSLLVVMGCSANSWAAAVTATPNSTSKTVHVNFLFGGQCYQNAFSSQYSWTPWYNAYLQANASSNIWNYLYTGFSGDVTFTTTRHGNNGAVYQVDLISTLSNANFNYGYSSKDVSAYTYANANWWDVSAFANAGSYGSAYNTVQGTSSATSDTTVFAKGANITEFKARVALNAGHFSDVFSSNFASAWSQASSYAGWWNYSSANANAQAWADLLSQSVVYMDITAHYQKKPGSNTDVETVVDNVTGYLMCGGAGTNSYASIYAYAF